MAEPTNAERMLQSWTNPGAVRGGLVVDIEIAPLGTTYDDATGKWERLGTIEPGSYKLDAEREKYVVERGYPKARAFSLIMGQKGNVSFTLDEVTAKAFEIANGGTATEYTTTSATTVSASPSPTTTVFTVAAIGTIAAGKWILHTNASGQKFMRKVASVATNAITLASPLPAAPASGDAIALVTSTRNVIGGDGIQQFCLRAVVCDQQGDKEVLYFKQAEPDGKLSPNFDPTKHAQIPMTFDLYGYSATVNGSTKFILGEIYVINA